MEAKQYTEPKVEQQQNFDPVLTAPPAAAQFQALPYVDEELDQENAPKEKKANIIGPLIRILLRKWWLIAIPTMAAGVAGFMFIPTSPLNFMGSFRLLVEPLTSEGAKAEPSALTGSDRIARSTGLDYVTQLEILRKPKLLKEIVAKVQTEYPEFTELQLKNGLTVRQVIVGKRAREGATKLIEVLYQEPQKPTEKTKETQEKVLFVLNKVAEEYLEYSLDERKNNISEAVKFIDEQIPNLEAEVNRIQDEIQQLQQRHNLTDISVLASELASQRSTIKSQIFQTNQQLAEQRTLYANLQRSLGTTTGAAIDAFALLQQTRYQELLVRLQAVESQIASESIRFKEDNPVIQVLREEQQTILQSLRQEAEMILGDNLTNLRNDPQLLSLPNQTRDSRIAQLVDTLTQIQILEVRKQVLEQEQRSLEQRTRDFPAIARRYSDLQNKLQITNQTFYQLLDNREKLRIEAAQKEVPWELVSEPDFPRYPETGQIIPVYGESRKKMLLMALMAGLGLGAGAALLIDISRNIFFTSKDVEDLIPVPMLGEIPRDRGLKTLAMSGDNSNSMKLSSSAEDSQFAGLAVGVSEDPEFLDAFSLLFANIRFLAADFPIRSLTISSAQIGDGKSTVALHLAQTVALMGQRVLLVDANLRRPTIHQRLNMSNVTGLSDLVTKKLLPNDLIERSPLVDNLFVLTAGPSTPAAAKLLAAPRMRYLMEELESMFDLIVYDTPHLYNLVDTNFLAEHTDGILMVISPKKTKRSAVDQVVDDLKNFNLSILGTVVNHVR